MPSNDSPIRFVPTGLSDGVIGDNEAAGKCTSLQNLIFDPATPGAFVCRPAAVQVFDFAG